MPSRTLPAPARRPTLADVAKMARLVLNHTEAGHGLDNRKLVIDLTTLRRNVDQVLDTISPPPTTDERVSFLVREVVRISQRQEQIAMSIATDIRDAAAEVGASAEAAAERVTAAIGQVRADLAAALATIEELIAAGSADSAALEEAKASLEAADAKIDSIEAEPAPGPDE